MNSLPHAAIAPAELLIPPDAGTFNVLPLSDLHLPTNMNAARRILGNKAYLRRMDYAVLLGDMCAAYGTDREYQRLDEFISQLERPYGAINGNHEFYFHVYEESSPQYGRTWAEQTRNEKVQQLYKFRHFFGYPSQWRASHTHLGSFIFLGIDDVCNHKPESLSAAQLRYLSEAVQVAPDKPAFIFCHVPLMFDKRLDMVYYDAERTACVEIAGAVRSSLQERQAPVFWISGHIHLRPDHYLFDAYLVAPGVWQVHCPDSWGYSRWTREQHVPMRHGELHSRHLEIARDKVVLLTHDHNQRADIARQEIGFNG